MKVRNLNRFQNSRSQNIIKYSIINIKPSCLFNHIPTLPINSNHLSIILHILLIPTPKIAHINQHFSNWKAISYHQLMYTNILQRLSIPNWNQRWPCSYILYSAIHYCYMIYIRKSRVIKQLLIWIALVNIRYINNSLSNVKILKRTVH